MGSGLCPLLSSRLRWLERFRNCIAIHSTGCWWRRRNWKDWFLLRWTNKSSVIRFRTCDPAQLLQRRPVEGEQAADRVLADVVLLEPGRTLVEEFEAAAGARGKARIGLDAVLELRLEGGILGQVFAGQLLQHVGLAVLLLLEDGIEEAPAQGGVWRLRLEPVNGDLGEPLVERDHDRSGGEGERLRGERASTVAAGLRARVLAGEDGMAALEGLALPLHSRAAVALDLAGPGCGGAAEGHIMGAEHVDDLGPLRGNDVSGRGRG